MSRSSKSDDGYFDAAHRLRLGKDQLDWKRNADAIDKYLKLYENACKPIGSSTINPAGIHNFDHFRSTFGDAPVDLAIDRKRIYEDARDTINSTAHMAIERYFLSASPNLQEVGRPARRHKKPNRTADNDVGRVLLETAARDLVRYFTRATKKEP